MNNVKEQFGFACYNCLHEHYIDVDEVLHIYHKCEHCGKIINLREESEYGYYLELRKKVTRKKYNKFKFDNYFKLSV